MIDIKQYLKETNSVLLSEQAYKYLLEKASVIEKLEAIKTEMDIIAELEEIKAEIVKGKCKYCDIDSNIQKCHEDNFTICDVYDILVIINEHIKKLEKI